MFDTHYREYCTAGVPNTSFEHDYATSPLLLLRSKIIQLIEQQFVSRYAIGVEQGQPRLAVLQGFRHLFEENKTHGACLACMMNASPEHELPCRHVLCEKCCVELGEHAERDPNMYTLARCPLCAATCDFRVRVRPATAGYRVLSLDGGGIRAKIPLQFLRSLEQAIGIDMPVQEHFDFSYGTSSGNNYPSRSA